MYCCHYCKKIGKDGDDVFILERDALGFCKVYCSVCCAEKGRLEMLNYLYSRIEEVKKLEIIKERW
jgi:hypothetical protein